MTNQPEQPASTPAASPPEPARSTTPARSRVLGFPDLWGEMERFWENFAPAPWRGARGLGRQMFMPAIEVIENEGNLQINAELPGMTDKDIQIEVTADSLTVSGEKRDEREVKEENYYRSERSYGSFRRQVPLPAGADTDNIEATFKDGVLKVTVPIKAAPTPSKKVEVKAG
jgi:HSP20 family protein